MTLRPGLGPGPRPGPAGPRCLQWTVPLRLTPSRRPGDLLRRPCAELAGLGAGGKSQPLVQKGFGRILGGFWESPPDDGTFRPRAGRSGVALGGLKQKWDPTRRPRIHAVRGPDSEMIRALSVLNRAKTRAGRPATALNGSPCRSGMPLSRDAYCRFCECDHRPRVPPPWLGLRPVPANPPLCEGRLIAALLRRSVRSVPSEFC